MMVRAVWVISLLPLTAQAEPIQHLEGPLFQVDGLGEITDIQLGSFRLDSSGSGDLRETPGTAELELSSGGTLTKSDGWVNEVRAVDPSSGRPLRSGGTRCATGAEPGCLPPSHCMPTATGPDPMGECDVSADVNAFRAINGGTIGFSNLDLSAGGLTVFNSLNRTGTPQVTISTAVSGLLAGDSTGLVFGGLLGVAIPGGPCDPDDVLSGTLCNPLVPLVADVTESEVDLDGPPLSFAEAVAAGLSPTPIDGAVLYVSGLQGLLSDPQQALFGCGPFYGTFCDGHGIGLMTTETGALTQSWPASGHTIDALAVQPGTVGSEGAPTCTRFESDQTFVLPGCRGLVEVGPDGVPDTLDEILAGTGDDTFDPGYDPIADGTTRGAGAIGTPFARAQPFLGRAPGCITAWCATTGHYFKSEMAVLSWNALMAFVALSVPPFAIDTDGDGVPDTSTDLNGDGWPDSQYIAQGEFDITRPFRIDGCSFATPYACNNVAAFEAILTQELADDPSGPPQRRWLWETGAEHLQTDEAAGGLADFADWTFHALGPEVSRRGNSEEAGVLFVLGPPDGVQTAPDSPLVVRGPGPDGLLGTEDDPFVGLAYGVVPEPSQVLMHLAALLAAAGMARRRHRRP